MNIHVNDTGEHVSLGINGPAKTAAIKLILVKGKRVTIQPITSKGMAQNCWVGMSVGAMDELAVLWLMERGQLSADDVSSFLEELANTPVYGTWESDF